MAILLLARLAPFFLFLFLFALRVTFLLETVAMMMILNTAVCLGNTSAKREREKTDEMVLLLAWRVLFSTYYLCSVYGGMNEALSVMIFILTFSCDDLDLCLQPSILPLNIRTTINPT